MHALVLYDSQFGNTERIARRMAESLGASLNAQCLHLDRASPDQLADLDLLIVGCPTQRLTATPKTQEFLKAIPSHGLRDVKVAAFDTRFTEEKIAAIKGLAFFVGIFGYAAEPIAKGLRRKGGEEILPPEGFYVEDTEGPLLEGELERAASWAGSMLGEQPGS